jgi:mRNA interferase RelE/StbE
MSQSTYKVELRPAAARDVRKPDKTTQKKVVVAIERLATEPRPSGVKKLEGEDNSTESKLAKITGSCTESKTTY